MGDGFKLFAEQRKKIVDVGAIQTRHFDEFVERGVVVESGAHQWADLVRQWLGINCEVSHSVDEVGQILALQCFDGIEVAVRWANVS